MKSIGTTMLATALIALSLTACSGNAANEGMAGNGTGVGNGGNAPAGGNAGTVQDGSPADGSAGGADESTGGGSSAGGRKTIVFAAFWPSDEYERAAKDYEAAHPNVTIKLQYGLSRPYGEDGGNGEQTDADIEKFTSATNAAMLAGEGPDVLDLRYLSADDYERHHLLADLGARMDGDVKFSKSDYFANVLESGRNGSSPYSIPLTFSLSGMVGDKAALAATGVKFDDRAWTWDDFMQTGRALVAAKGKYDAAVVSGEGFQVGGTDYFVRSVVADDYSRFVDDTSGKASFDSPAFTDLLQRIKSMFDDGVVGTAGRGYFINATIRSPEDYLTTLNSFGDDTAFYAKPHADGEAEGASFEPGSLIGINAGSKAKDEAWDFVKYLMDHTATGLPINKARFADAVSALKQKGTITPPAIGSQPAKPFKVDGAQLDRLESFAEAAGRKKNDAGKVLDIVAQNTPAFFAGQKSAEDVAKLIQNKATTLLHE